MWYNSGSMAFLWNKGDQTGLWLVENGFEEPKDVPSDCQAVDECDMGSKRSLCCSYSVRFLSLMIRNFFETALYSWYKNIRNMTCTIMILMALHTMTSSLLNP